MTLNKLCTRIFILAAVVAMFGGCTTLAQRSSSGSKPAASTITPAPIATPTAAHVASLNDGIMLYDQGDFNGAIKKLSSSPEIWSSDKVTQISALKYMAFSYCVTSRQLLCRQQFEKILQLDPAFDLEPGEKMHPLWAPAFDQAKKNSLKNSSTGNDKPTVKRKKSVVIKKPVQ